MRIAIISDTHGNLTALDAVLADLDRSGPYDAVLMGGDIAYGGPFPAECISRIMELSCPVVRGNTDQMILDSMSGRGGAQGAWIVEQLTEEMIRFLQELPVQEHVEIGTGRTLGLVHATPWSIYDVVSPDDTDAGFRRMLSESGTDLLAYGHIHLQHQRRLATGHVVAVGSVGLPFDGDQRSMYTVVDAAAGGWNVEFRRVEYDVEQAINDARTRGGPDGETFARNLQTATRPG